MHNIEIKAAVRDLEAIESTAANVAGPAPPTCLMQTDTYFNIDHGRLKLREKMGEETGAELIFYRREDSCSPKSCDYEIVSIEEPQKLKELLSEKLGVRTIVKKRRKIFLIENARIHLDQVDGLGSFFEIEIVMPPDALDEEGESFVYRLLDTFSIDPDNLLDCSYCDLMERKDRML
jgi:predicted adenylyl cyclase CyaB